MRPNAPRGSAAPLDPLWPERRPRRAGRGGQVAKIAPIVKPMAAISTAMAL
jgi:hypothetical protein